MSGKVDTPQSCWQHLLIVRTRDCPKIPVEVNRRHTGVLHVGERSPCPRGTVHQPQTSQANRRFRKRAQCSFPDTVSERICPYGYKIKLQLVARRMYQRRCSLFIGGFHSTHKTRKNLVVAVLWVKHGSEIILKAGQ